jgi:hypothetical protein
MKALIPLAAVAALLAACGGGEDASTETETGGSMASQSAEAPAASGSDQPANAAIDTTPMTDAGQTPGANSFTEEQAREAFEKAGYTGLTQLTKNDQGLWTATGTLNGQSAQVSLDYRGAVVTP